MPITEKQRQDRRKYVGSSDAAAILNLDPFRSSYDVWLEKTGRLNPQGNELAHQTRGNFIERATLDWFTHETKEPIRRNVERSAKRRGLPMKAHIDAMAVAKGCPVEAKSVGAYADEVWGETGTDEIPDRVIIQTHHQMICAESEFCFVPVLLPYRDFCLFYVTYNKKVGDIITEGVLNFWENNVLKDTPPEDSMPSLNIAKRIRSTEGEVPVSHDLIENLVEAKAILKSAKAEHNAAQAILLAALDGAPSGVSEQGRIVTNYEQERKGYEVKPSSYRVLRIQKAKQKK